HIGSQLTEVKPFESAVREVVPLAEKLAAKYPFEFFSIGGGLGIVYQPALASGGADWWQTPKAKDILTPAKYAATLVPLLKSLPAAGAGRAAVPGARNRPPVSRRPRVEPPPPPAPRPTARPRQRTTCRPPSPSAGAHLPG